MGNIGMDGEKVGLVCPVTSSKWKLLIEELINPYSRNSYHYAKWNKPVRERQVPYDFTYVLNLMKKWTNKQNTNELR